MRHHLVLSLLIPMLSLAGWREDGTVYLIAYGSSVPAATNDPVVLSGSMPDYYVYAPTTVPESFAAYAPPVSNDLVASASAPVIEEYTRQNDSGDTLAYTGDTSNFVVYAIGATNQLSTTNYFSDAYGALTLTNSLASDEVYMLWPVNDSYTGTPVVINKTEAWWVQNEVITGETFRVYGRSLTLGAGNSYLYWSNNTTAATGWLTNEVTNPYMNEYTAGTGWGLGEYTLWSHNGKGRAYGWSDGLTMDVVADTQWNDDTNTWLEVTSYADLNAAIVAADAVDWSTIHLPAGTHELSVKWDLTNRDYIRIVGEGMDETTVQPGEPYTTHDNFINADNCNRIRFENFQIVGSSSVIEDLIEFDGGAYVELYSVRVDQSLCPVDFGDANVAYDNVIQFLNSTNSGLFSCEIIGMSPAFFTSSIFSQITNCTFKGRGDAYTLLSVSGQYSHETRIVGNTFKNFDESSLTNSMSRCMGRCVYGKYGFKNCYIAENESINMAPHENYTDRNVGEHIMYENARTYLREQPTVVSDTVLTFTSVPAEINVGMVAVIQNGRGQGQNRVVTAISPTTVTIDSPWAVNPNTSSYIQIGNYSDNFVVYNNIFNGSDLAGADRGVTYTSRATASMGVEFYGGGVDIVVANNAFSDLRYAISTRSLVATGEYEPNFFGQYIENTFDNCGYDITLGCHEGATTVLSDPTIFANVFRDNVGTNNFISPVRYAGVYDGYTEERIDMAIFERNEHGGFPADVINYSVYDPPNSPKEIVDPTRVFNQVYIGITTNGVSWNP